jgi:N-acetyl-anhydromuramyl-L-alanine amidase AmpD
MNPESKVSYHYLVGRSGTVYQFVADNRRAWHAGVSTYRGQSDCNNFTLGVSFANNQKGEPFPPDQITAGAELVALLCLRHGIPVDRITTHAAVSPGRKTDPGKLFNLPHFIDSVNAELDP